MTLRKIKNEAERKPKDQKGNTNILTWQNKIQVGLHGARWQTPVIESL